MLHLYAFADSFGRPAFVFFHFMTALALIGLVLMHSGRDTGMAGMGYVPASQGGTHIVERNLTRLTIVVGTIFFANTVVLYHLLK
jgi:preprotein translocase subunit SecG